MSVETFVPNETLITVTDKAQAFFSNMLKSKPNHYIRFSTKVSGCTGFAYVLDMVETPEPDDEIIQFSPTVTFAVANASIDIVRNTQIDYVTEGINGVIKYNNPNVVNSCGCGESFNVG